MEERGDEKRGSILRIHLLTSYLDIHTSIDTCSGWASYITTAESQAINDQGSPRDSLL